MPTYHRPPRVLEELQVCGELVQITIDISNIQSYIPHVPAQLYMIEVPYNKTINDVVDSSSSTIYDRSALVHQASHGELIVPAQLYMIEVLIANMSLLPDSRSSSTIYDRSVALLKKRGNELPFQLNYI